MTLAPCGWPVQVSGVRSDLDRVQQDKVDATALEAYTQRVSALFQQVSRAVCVCV